MKKDKIILDVTLSVLPEQLYSDWLNSNIHSKFTGGEAQINDIINADYSAWDGYILGKNVLLETGKTIIQTWRTSEFDQNDEDSILELLFEPIHKNHTKLTLIHSNIPSGEGEKYKQGWCEHYFTPMKSYYDNLKK